MYYSIFIREASSYSQSCLIQRLKAHYSEEKKWDICIILYPFQGSDDITEEGTERLIYPEVGEI